MIIACLQLAPQLRHIDNNLKQADEILRNANAKFFDLLVLPDLVFTGSNFGFHEHPSPFLEHTTAGITSVWARTTAMTHRCVVMAGYPEIESRGPNYPVGCYSSTIIVGSKGNTIANQRKSFLYSASSAHGEHGLDRTLDGSVETLGNVSIGSGNCQRHVMKVSLNFLVYINGSNTIILDIDTQPDKFEPEWQTQEFTKHIVRKQPDVVVLSMAWGKPEFEEGCSPKPDIGALSSWTQRLLPLIQARHKKEVIVILANRCGAENSVQYTGTSAVLGIKEGKIQVYGMLGRDEESLLVVDTSKPAKTRVECEAFLGDGTPSLLNWEFQVIKSAWEKAVDHM